ncbi:MAG: PAS domain S-box protein [Cyclobacteriaceae bacterium]|nr:PAS domain S-box protein [Cyclobacteriaceae bacterium]
MPVISGEALKEIFQSMMEGFVVIDKDGIILVINPIGEKMFGYGPGELIGKPLELLLPERYRGHHVHLRREFNGKPVPRRMGLGRDLMGMRKDGMEFPVEISLSYSKAGGTFIAIAFISDITLRKKAEDALRQSEEQLIVYATELEKKVKTRTEDLNTSIHNLEKEVAERKKAEEEVLKALAKERELNDMKSKFVSIASHEFRTPLSTILSSISLIEQYRQVGQLDKIDKHIARARASANHMTTILNDFLSVGRLEEGKVEIIREQVVVHELLHDIADEIKLMLKPGQKIDMELRSEIKSIYTDTRMLRNILFNLLSNASKYSEEGKSIRLSCSSTPAYLQVNIEDQGIGIPDEDQRHLFDRFFRASNALNIQGTGLGLNIVKRYLDLLNGTISFTSEYGKGSTFTFQLPIQLS